RCREMSGRLRPRTRHADHGAGGEDADRPAARGRPAGLVTISFAYLAARRRGGRVRVRLSRLFPVPARPDEPGSHEVAEAITNRVGGAGAHMDNVVRVTRSQVGTATAVRLDGEHDLST